MSSQDRVKKEEGNCGTCIELCDGTLDHYFELQAMSRSWHPQVLPARFMSENERAVYAAKARAQAVRKCCHTFTFFMFQ